MAEDLIKLLDEELKELRQAGEDEGIALKKLPIIARTFSSDECVSKLLPYVKELAESLEDEPQLHLAEAIEGMAPVFGAANCSQLMTPLKTVCENAETVVRSQAVKSCEAIAKLLVSSDSPEFLGIFNELRAKEASQFSKMSACGMLPSAYIVASTSGKAEIKAALGELSSDEAPMVRAAALAAVGDLAAVVDKSLVGTDLLPVFSTLAAEAQEAVLENAIPAAVKLATALEFSDACKDFMKALAKPPADRSVKIRVDKAKHIVAMSKALGRETADLVIPDIVTQLISDFDWEVRLQISQNLANLVPHLSPNIATETFIPSIQANFDDSQVKVREALTEAVVKLVPQNLPGNANNLLCQLIDKALEDESQLVRGAAISGLGPAIDALGPDMVSSRFFPVILALFRNKGSQWRVRQALVEILPNLASSMGRDVFEKQLNTVVTDSLTDPVFSVRQASWAAASNLCSALGDEWAGSIVLPEMNAILAKETQYLYRISVICACQAIAKSRTGMRDTVIPIIAKLLSEDAISNVKLAAARALYELKQDGITHQEGQSALSSNATSKDTDVAYYCSLATTA